jgi:hypothetical protein
MLHKAKAMMSAFKPVDMDTHKDPEKHNIDWKGLLKDIGT